MPDDNRDHGLDNLRLTGGLFSIASLVMFVGSWISYGTGEDFGRGRTHMDAALVLLFLGIAFGLASVVVLREHLERRRTPERRRSDWE